MIEYENIFKAYEAIDDYLGRQEAEDERNRDTWTKYRTLNDHAYFVMFIAQIEQLINEQAKKLVRRKKDKKVHERAWDVIEMKNFEDKYRLSFKLDLLVGQGSHITNDIENYYKVRSQIAHGSLHGSLDEFGRISDLAKQVKELAGNITRQGEEQ